MHDDAQMPEQILHCAHQHMQGQAPAPSSICKMRKWKVICFPTDILLLKQLLAVMYNNGQPQSLSSELIRIECGLDSNSGGIF